MSARGRARCCPVVEIRGVGGCESQNTLLPLAESKADVEENAHLRRISATIFVS